MALAIAGQLQHKLRQFAILCMMLEGPRCSYTEKITCALVGYFIRRPRRNFVHLAQARALNAIVDRKCASNGPTLVDQMSLSIVDLVLKNLMTSYTTKELRAGTLQVVG